MAPRRRVESESRSHGDLSFLAWRPGPLCYGLYIAAWLVNTLVLTLLLALVVSPILFGLRRRGWPAWAAVLGGFLVVFGITLVFLVLGLISLSQMDDNLPFYQQRLTEIATIVADRLNATNPPLYDLSTIRRRLRAADVQYLVPLAFNVVGLARLADPVHVLAAVRIRRSLRDARSACGT